MRHTPRHPRHVCRPAIFRNRAAGALQPLPFGGVTVSIVRPKTYRLAVVVLALAFAGATTLAWQQYQELVTLRATALAGDERAAFEARLAELKRHNYDLQAQLAALQLAKTAAESAADVAQARATARESAAVERAQLAALLAKDSGGASKQDEAFELLGALADTPEFQRLLALEQHGQVDAKYAALFRKLHLNPEDQARLESLLTDKQSAFADAMIAAHDQGLTGQDARALANAVASATQKDINASIKDLLGPQGFSQYQNYDRTLPQRAVVDQLAQWLSYTAAPLTTGQQDRLVQTLATTAAAPPRTPGANTPNGKPVPPVAPLPGALAGLGVGSVPSAPITTAAVAQSQSFLSPQQVAALQQMRQQQQAQQTLNNVLNGKAPASPAPPSAPKPGK